MKIAEIVKQTEEYNRLQTMIDNIEKALEVLNRKDQNIFDGINTINTINATISIGTTDYMYINNACVLPLSLLVVSLSESLVALKNKQYRLEV